MMWDIITPPHPTLRRFAGLDLPLRIRCISLNNGSTGITVICCGGRIYGIHMHRDHSSAPKPTRLQDRLVWLYFPIGPEEEMCAIWIYRDKFKASIFIYTYSSSSYLIVYKLERPLTERTNLASILIPLKIQSTSMALSPIFYATTQN